MKNRKITTKIDSITNIPDSHMAAVIPAPKAVKIEISPRCNFRCNFCALTTRDHQPRDDMDLDFFKRITKDMRVAGVEEVGMFYIGESFMNIDLLEAAIKYLKDELQMPYVFLTTNGSVATPDKVKRVMAAGLDSLKFSVNAENKENFVKVMAAKPIFFDRLFNNIKTAREIRDAGNYDCGIYASSIKYDGDQLAKMEALLDEKVRPYVDEHYWLPLYSFGSYAGANEIKMGMFPTAGNMGRADALVEPLPCWCVFTEGHVTADGKLSACGFDADSHFTCADLYEVDFMTGWNSQTFTELRMAHLNKDVKGTVCEACIAYG